MPENEAAATWQSIAQELLSHRHQSETLADQRPLFEEFLAKFPTAVSLLIVPLHATMPNVAPSARAMAQACVSRFSCAASALFAHICIRSRLLLWRFPKSLAGTVACVSVTVLPRRTPAIVTPANLHRYQEVTVFQALHWRAYAELAMAVNSPEVRTIFSRSLLNCPNLDLWTTYLNFIKRVSGILAGFWHKLHTAQCLHAHQLCYTQSPSL